jgi:hypothetical protein
MQKIKYVPSIKLQAISSLLSRVPTGGKLNDLIHERINILTNLGEAIDELINNPDPMKSRLAIDGEILRLKHVLRMATQDLGKTLTDALDAEKERLDGVSADNAGLTQDEYAAETRTAVRSMDASQRLQFLNEAIKNNDGATVAAVTEAPAHLSGITPHIIDELKRSFLANFAPLGKQKALTEIHEAVTAILRVSAEMASYSA